MIVSGRVFANSVARQNAISKLSSFRKRCVNVPPPCLFGQDVAFNFLHTSDGPILARLVCPRRSHDQRRASTVVLSSADRLPMEPATALEPKIHIRFMLPLSVSFGDSIVLCGESEELGRWDPHVAPRFTWSPSDLWILDAELPASKMIEFKVVHITAGGDVVWEYSNNRVLDVPSVESMRDGEVTLTWCDQSVDVMTPRILSSLASWDEVDGSLEGGSSMPFGNLLGFMTTSDDEIVTKESAVDELRIDDSIAQDEVAMNVIELEEDQEMDEVEEAEEPGADGEVQAETEMIADSLVQDEVLSKKEKKDRATARALKNVATAGVVLAGIGGAAALAGIAFDAAIVDTVR